MRHRFLLALACGLASLLVQAAPASTPLDPAVRYGNDDVTYTLNEDGTSVETHQWSRTVLKPQAVEWVKEASISYSTSAQKAEILEAYTRKADGRRIDVRKDTYQLNINKGNEGNNPAYSDYTSQSVVFPDVAVGDSVVFSYRITQTDPIFPGHFSLSDTYSSQRAVDSVKVVIDFPAKLQVQYQSHGMKDAGISESNGRKHLELSYSNPQPLKSKRTDYSVYNPEKETGYYFSTFRSYDEIAQAYGKRALPKAAVTERIQKLADEIVGNKTDKREQARALYEWVATNITYAGNCIGVGAVVPRDLSFVLDNKMGDCKDHATLLQALLSARNIQSQQALVNAGSTYTLPKTPVVSTVNHVINYLPAFDLYVDSTSNSTPFGMLPGQDRGKPVLLIGEYREGARTPTPKMATEHRAINKLKIAADGTLSGTLEVFLKGDFAVGMREWARNSAKEDEQDIIKQMFRARGLNGEGSFSKDDATALTDTYHYKASITKAEKYLKLPGNGAFNINPLMGGIMNVVPSGLAQEEKTEIACTNGSFQEEYEIELPKNMKVLSMPSNMKQSNRYQTYQAQYSLKNNLLKIKRSFEDRTPFSVCSPDIVEDYRQLGEKVLDNLQTQVLYQARS